MRVFVDTNIIISAILFSSRSMRTLIETAVERHQLIISDAVATECHRVTHRLRPDRMEEMERFLTDPRLTLLSPSAAVPTRVQSIRDESDQQILDDALSSEVDIILTGDKDFHALEMRHPRVLTPAQFEREFIWKED